MSNDEVQAIMPILVAFIPLVGLTMALTPRLQPRAVPAAAPDGWYADSRECAAKGGGTTIRRSWRIWCCRKT